MRNLMDELRVGLRHVPALHGALRAGKAALSRVHPTAMQRRVRERAERIERIAGAIGRMESERGGESGGPVLFFDVSSHLANLSFNAAAGLVASWGLRVAGHPVRYVRCEGGAGLCVLGTDQEHPSAPPPCAACVAQNRQWYASERAVMLERRGGSKTLETRLGEMALEELREYEDDGLPLGRMCVPSAQWILRRADLSADPAGRVVLASYVGSAAGLARRFGELIERERPRGLVVFNGTFWPEAVARSVALRLDIPVVTYEAGYRALSAFFTSGVATEYPVEIPDSFGMGEAENRELDAYLAGRTRGDFAMAGVRFWPEMKSVGAELRAKVEAHEQVVTVFTNVVFDTSQTYVHTVFGDMFEWLAATVGAAAEHPETLFVVRAHPDELRPGKASRETAETALRERGLLGRANVVFIPPTEYVSSYELIGLSKFCAVYNSTVGLEAAILGRPVIVGGLTRYAQADAVRASRDREEYGRVLGELLRGAGASAVSEAQLARARRYMYYSIFKVGLDLSAFIEEIGPAECTVREFGPEALGRERSREMGIIVDGILEGRPFCYS